MELRWIGKYFNIFSDVTCSKNNAEGIHFNNAYYLYYPLDLKDIVVAIDKFSRNEFDFYQ